MEQLIEEYGIGLILLLIGMGIFKMFQFLIMNL